MPSHLKYSIAYFLPHLAQIQTLMDKGALNVWDILSGNNPKLQVTFLLMLGRFLQAGKERMIKENLDSNPYTEYVEQCNALDKIEQLQTVPSKEVYQQALFLLETYFSSEEDIPSAAPNTFTF